MRPIPLKASSESGRAYWSSWLLRLVASGILFQSLVYKFGAHPDSVVLFSLLGVEPIGRLGLGVLELLTGILILLPKTHKTGSILGIMLMSGAIMTHLFLIGINFRQDHGTLFFLALGCFVACCLNVYLHFNPFSTQTKSY